MPSRKQPYGVTSEPTKSVKFLLVKVQILTMYTSHHFVQNDKTQFLFPVRGCHAVPRIAVGRDWRRRIIPLTRVYRASNPPLCVVNVNGGLRGNNITVTPMSQPPQYTASPVQTSRPTKRWLRRNGTSHVPYERMASPERDEPRSLQKDGFSGTGRPAFPTKDLRYRLSPRLSF
jgi:hypothetical protein